MKNIIKRKWIATMLAITMLVSTVLTDYSMVHASDRTVLAKSQIFEFSSADELHKGSGAEVANGKLNINIASAWGAARARLPYVFEKGENYSITFDLDVETSSQPKVWVVLASNADNNAGVDNSDAGMAKRLSTQLNAGTLITAGTGYKYTFDFNASVVTDDLIDQGYKYFGIFVQSGTAGKVYIDNVKIGLKGTTIYDFSSAEDLHKGAGAAIANERLEINIANAWGAARARLPYVFEKDRDYSATFHLDVATTSAPKVWVVLASDADNNAGVDNSDAGMAKRLSTQLNAGTTITAGTGYTYTFDFNASAVTDNLIDQGYKYFGIFVQSGTAGDVYIDNVVIHQHEKVAKAEKPDAPQIMENTQNSVTLVAHEGYEYRVGDDGEWQSSNVFEGLENGVEYKFYQRVAATDSILASDASEALVFVIVNNYNGQFEFNESGELDYAYSTAGTVTVSDGKLVWEQNATYQAIRARLPYVFEHGKQYKIEYSYSMTNTNNNISYPQLAFYYAQNVDSWEVVKNSDSNHRIYSVDYQQWISSEERTGEYVFVANIPENGYEYMGIFAQPSHAGVLSINYIRISEVNKQATPEAPQLLENTQNSVTLVAHEGYEYRVGDDGEWQSSNVFEGLQSGVEYKFYQRVAAEGSLMASDASEALVFAIKNNYNGQFDFNESGELDYVTTNGGTVSVQEGKLVWEQTNASDAYKAIKARLPYAFENDKIYKIEYSYSMTRLSEGDTNYPQLAFYYAKDVDSWDVVKNGVEGHSIYAVDKGQWVSGSQRTGKIIFTANSPEASYEYMGIFAQPAYAGTLTIDYIKITEMHTQATPEEPIIQAQTQNSITLQATEGYEYRVNNGEWQNSPVFKGLFANTTYIFEQRVAESATGLVSEVSASTEYTIVLSGDSNANKFVTIDDLMLLREYLVEKITASMCNRYGCDSNEDNTIDVCDIINLKKKLANPEKYYAPEAALSEEYYLVFADNFDGTDLSTNNWTVVPHKAGLIFDDGHEVYMGYHSEYDLVTVDDGILTMKMAKDTSGENVKYYGSEIRMLNKTDFSYGYVEMRAKLAEGTNLWNSFWATGSNRNPVSGEIDIFETLGIGTLNPNIHLWWNTDDSNLPSYLDETGHKNFELNQMWLNSSGYHTYGFEWTEDSLTWYIDGVKKYSLAMNDEIYTEFKDGDPLYLILSLSTGRSDAYVSNKVLQETMEVDYIRIYQK